MWLSQLPRGRARKKSFARSRGALPVDTEEIKDLATDWAERKTDEVIAKEQRELEKLNLLPSASRKQN